MRAGQLSMAQRNVLAKMRRSGVEWVPSKELTAYARTLDSLVALGCVECSATPNLETNVYDYKYKIATNCTRR